MKFLGNLFRKKDKKAEPKPRFGVPLSPSSSPSRDYDSSMMTASMFGLISSQPTSVAPSSDVYHTTPDWIGSGGDTGGAGASSSWDSGCDTSSSYSDSGSSDSGSCSSSD